MALDASRFSLAGLALFFVGHASLVGLGLVAGGWLDNAPMPPPWTGAALLMGACLICPRRYLPAIVSAAFLGWLGAWLVLGVPSLILCAVTGGIEVCGTAVLCLLLRRLRDPARVIGHTSDLILFMVLGVGGRMAVISLGHALAWWSWGEQPLVSTWIAFWAGDAMMLLLITPAVVGGVSGVLRIERPLELALGALFAMIVSVAGALRQEPTFLFLLIPVFIFAAVRLKHIGLLVIGLIVVGVALGPLYGTLSGAIRHDQTLFGNPISDLQLFVAIVVATALLLATLVEERDCIQDQLERNRSELAQNAVVLQATLDGTSQGLALFDENEALLVWNKRFEEMFEPYSGTVHHGMTQTEMVRRLAAKGTYGIVSWEERAEERIKYLRSGGYWDLRTVNLPHGGVYRNQAYPVPGIGMLCTYLDLTERESAERDRDESQRQLSSIMANLPGMAYRVANNERWTSEFASAGVQRLLGYQPEDFTSGRVNFGDLTHPDDRDWVRREVQSRLSEREAYDLEFQLRRKDGTYAWVWKKGSGVFDEEGTLLHLEGFIIDITALQEARAELAGKNRLLETILQSMSEGIIVYDRDQRIQAWNEYVEKHCLLDRIRIRVGMTRDDLIQQMFTSGFYSDDEHDRLARSSGDLETLPRRQELKRSDGRVFLMRRFVMPDGGQISVLGDVTQSKNAERLVRESEERFRDFARSASDVFWETGPDHCLTLIETNGREEFKAFERSLENTLAGLCRGISLVRENYNSIDEYLEQREAFRDLSYSFEYNNERRWQKISGVPVFAPDFRFKGFRGAISDTTEARRNEEKLRLSEERLQLAMAGINEGVWDWYEGTGDIYLSDRFIELTGLPAKDNRLTIPEFFNRVHEDDRQLLRGATRDHFKGATDYFGCEMRMLGPGAVWRWYRIRGAALRDGRGHVFRMCGSLADVTQEKQREEALLQAQKLEAIGRLTGGIAHDFNNLLAAIRGFSKFLTEDLPTESPAQNYAHRIQRVTDRGIDLVTQILAFSRPGIIEVLDVDLEECIDQVRELLSATMPASIQLTFHNTLASAIVKGDSARLTQLIMNLCVNARDALPQQSGEISVAVSDVTELEAASLVATGVEPVGMEAPPRIEEARDGSATARVGYLTMSKSYVVLVVADTGTGMTSDTLRQAFDPFFTTKGHGRGTGIGLSVVLNTVRSLGGACRVVARKGHGTEFRIYLEASAPGNLPARDRTAVKGASRGSESVLIVDDEIDVSDAISIGLERLGYETATSTDPLETLELFSEAPREWDVVVTDQIMPGMRGMDLIVEMKRIHPRLKAILCTGYSDSVFEEAALRQGADAFFTKPVDSDRIAEKIRYLVDSDRDR